MKPRGRIAQYNASPKTGKVSHHSGVASPLGPGSVSIDGSVSRIRLKSVMRLPSIRFRHHTAAAHTATNIHTAWATVVQVTPRMPLEVT